MKGGSVVKRKRNKFENKIQGQRHIEFYAVVFWQDSAFATRSRLAPEFKAYVENIKVIAVKDAMSTNSNNAYFP